MPRIETVAVALWIEAWRMRGLIYNRDDWNARPDGEKMVYRGLAKVARRICK